MKVKCQHGFFKYYPDGREELRTFQRLFRIELVREADYFTFKALAGLPRYSLQGSLYKSSPALVTFEGREAADVMRENGFIYHLQTEQIIPYTLVLTTITLLGTQSCTVAPSWIVQPGARMQNGLRILGYEGEIDLNTQRLYIYSGEFAA